MSEINWNELKDKAHSNAVSIIASIKSSASTTVPSRLFILPSGNSTIPQPVTKIAGWHSATGYPLEE